MKRIEHKSKIHFIPWLWLLYVALMMGVIQVNRMVSKKADPVKQTNSRKY